MRTKCLAALAVSTILLVSVSAFAQGEPSDDLFAPGLQLQEQGKFADALASFQRAHAKNPTLVTTLHIAECEAATERLVRAETHLRALIAVPLPEGSPAASYAAQAQARVELAALAPRVPHLHVRVSPPTVEGVWVTIDGVPVDPGAEAHPVDPGRHDLVATTLDGRRASTTVTVREGQLAEAQLVLRSGSVDEDEHPASNGGRNVGTALVAVGGATIGFSLLVILVGGLQNICIFAPSDSDACHRGDGLIAGGAVAMGVGFVGVLAGIALITANPRTQVTQAGAARTSLVPTSRIPVWNTAVERAPTAGMPVVVPIYSGSF